MKLRQKLAVALAAAVITTSVPVVTMAASKNGLKSETLKVAEDTTFYTVATANAVTIQFENQKDTEVFYLELENAEFDKDVVNNAHTATDFPAGVKYEWQNKKTVKVTVNKVDASEKVQLPLLTTVKEGDAKVSITTQGSGSTVSAGSWVFATTSEKSLIAKAGEKTSIYTKGEIAEITLEESYKGALAGAEDGEVELTLELDDTDFQFVDFATKTKLGSDNVEFKYGFTNSDAANYTAPVVYAERDEKDAGKLILTITAPEFKGDNVQDSIGTIVLKGLEVKSTTKTPEEGELLLDVKGDSLVETQNNLVVAQIAKYSNFIEMKDEKAVEIVAGRKENIEFTIGETVEDSIVGGREFTVKLDNAHFDYKALVDKYDSDFNEKNDKDDKAYKTAAADLEFKVDVVAEDKQEIVDSVTFDVDEDGRAIVDTLIVTLNAEDKDEESLQKNEVEDKVKFKTSVCVPITSREEEKVTITASGRALETEVSTTAVTIKNPIEIETEAVTLKVGLAKQVGGKIVIKETDKEMLQKGNDITLKIKDQDRGISIVADAKLEVTGGIKKAEIKTSDKNKDGEGAVDVTINRASKEAATLTISDLTFTVDRTVPEGSYDLEISGLALDQDGHKIVVEDFVVVGTPNTEDLTANGLRRGTTTFAIGEATYTANGIAYPMTAAAYIQDPGYTMIPVRYVAEAFGVAQKDILFSAGTATFFAGERTIQLTNGSDVAIVNGAPIKLATKVVIKDNRTYAPVGEVAKILGIKGTWDNTNKVATFINE